MLTGSVWTPVVDSDDNESCEESVAVKETNDELSESVKSDSSSVKTGIDLVEVKVSDRSASSIVNTDIDGVGEEVSGSNEEGLVDDAMEEELRVTVRLAWIARVVSSNQLSVFVKFVSRDLCSFHFKHLRLFMYCASEEANRRAGPKRARPRIPNIWK